MLPITLDLQNFETVKNVSHTVEQWYEQKTKSDNALPEIRLNFGERKSFQAVIQNSKTNPSDIQLQLL
ncbi:MAG: hypothetical protein KF816_15710 [Melioribacteraceae bacterium]|jgi:hypothetical protein|nr:hypothetical protein [Melioribacteraceae bacterium]